MDYDLLFTVVEDQNWKEITSSGTFKPSSLEELGYIKCIDEKDLQQYVNQEILTGKELLLVVIDPLRVRDSIKADKENGFSIIKLYGELTLDALIDKIELKPSKKGDYTIKINHYD
ncbi:MAG TPA: hypothetical protein DF712_21835 [Balneola sp.]|jgi:uncharacterized protein (DUF952 family)|nr:hypothetical protein [Balneola sp.]MAO78190.1 hypothetical protein [Balneola sp.]MBF64191.1 hypothetical protein [Balneola sp.]HAW78346.1 hypothetical protein [Balneola sp.]HBZ40161.1 hypothetical protein [Balneola sp.]|tara:strand:+ start:4393 stop:4740 length:348 start_codon:yes stop_codon:yes gene_type:complete